MFDLLLENFIKNFKPSDFFFNESVFAEAIIAKSSYQFVKNLNGTNNLFEWKNENLTFYTYKIKSIYSSKYYYGVSHVKIPNATKEDCKEHNYYGSGGLKYKNWKAKYISSLDKEIINLFKSKKDAYRSERLLISDLYIKDSDCLNSAAGGKDPRINKKNSRFVKKYCSIHKNTTFNNEKCVKCYVQKANSSSNCEVHGKAYFVLDKCRKCIQDKKVNLKYCEIHGLVKFQSNSCYKCFLNKRDTTKNCDVHGLSSFIGNSCRRCSHADISIKKCDLHGETKFEKDICFKCRASTKFSEDICKIHGQTIFMSQKCMKCSSAKIMNLQNCKIHGQTLHQSNTCKKCVSLSSINYSVCILHGKTKHRGKRCYSCISLKTAHTKHHKDDKASCWFCKNGIDSWPK